MKQPPMKNSHPPANPSSELAEILTKKIPFDMVADALFRALTATTVTKSGAVEQDTRSQLLASTIILENRVGRPVQRTEAVNVNLDAESEVGTRERLKAAPALRRRLRQILDEIDADGAVDV